MKTTKKILSKKKTRVYLPLILTALVVSILSVSLYVLKAKYDLSIRELLQNVANPNIRYVKITPGLRREEVVDRFGDTLGWSETEREKLVATHKLATNGKDEGYYFPATYIVSRRSSAEEVSAIIIDSFNEKVLEKQDKLKNNIINTDTALKIASIIEREAGKGDMKIISGIIWNRIFRNMTLDMDATLQYAKGTEKKWWPQVKSEDKYINSEFNTYKYKGLPPAPISNPSEAAIEAALNPAKTKALFYVHDSNGIIHTAETYEQHKANIARYY